MKRDKRFQPKRHKLARGLFAFVILMVVAALSGVFAMAKPENLGVQNGQLAPLVNKPNNLSTYEKGAYAQATPLSYSGDMAAARDALVAVLGNMDRSKVQSVDGNYVHATFRSRIFKFVDDVEFLFDDEAKIIHFRAGARTGYGDMGVNQKRMEEIRAAFEKSQ